MPHGKHKMHKNMDDQQYFLAEPKPDAPTHYRSSRGKGKHAGKSPGMSGPSSNKHSGQGRKY